MSGATVAVDNLHRMLYNCKLFQVGKTAPPVILTFGEEKFQASVNDDLTYLTDVSNCHGSGGFALSLPSVTVKKLELYLRDVPDTFIDIWWYPAADRFVADAVSYDAVEGVDEHVDMLDPDQWDFPTWDTFEVLPGSLRKLELLKPGDFPPSLRRCKHNKYGELLLFKAGPTVKGAISVLDRDELLGHPDSSTWMW